MKAAQFIRGKIDGIQKRFESPNLDKLLPNDKLNELKDNVDIGVYPQFYKQSRALINTVVKAADNSDGRRGGVINHTVIYSYDASVEHDGVKYIFDLDNFISEILAGKHRWKMPSAPKLPDADSGIIEAPQPIEWEV